MSKKNALGKLYDRLTPSERFRLDVEAQARGDEAESRRLVDSCPIRNYRMTDWAFSGRWQTTTEIVLVVGVDFCQYMSRLNMIDAIRQTLPYARNIYHNETGGAYLSGQRGRKPLRLGACGDERGPSGLGAAGRRRREYGRRGLRPRHRRGVRDARCKVGRGGHAGGVDALRSVLKLPSRRARGGAGEGDQSPLRANRGQVRGPQGPQGEVLSPRRQGPNHRVRGGFLRGVGAPTQGSEEALQVASRSTLPHARVACNELDG